MADVTTIYRNFRGVDFRGEEIDLTRSPDSVNMWKDYREIDSIRTRPALKLFDKFNDTVWGIFFYKVRGMEHIFVHAGTNLYMKGTNSYRLVYGGLNERPSNAFIFDDIWYFMDGKNYLCFDGGSVKKVTGYIPTTSISRTPIGSVEAGNGAVGGGGKKHEDVNLLTGLRKNSFIGDGINEEFFLDVQDIDKDFEPIVMVNGVKYDPAYVDYKKGKISFALIPPPPAPSTVGQDNVVITFKKTVKGYADKINKCTIVQMFDNRIFVSGNPDYPNTIWHCSLNEPKYFSDDDRYNEGLDSGTVKGIVAGNDALWIFKEPSQANTTVFYHRPQMDYEYGKIYPSVHSSISTGCIGKAINFNDDIIFFSDRGAEGINGDITTEQVIAHRSSLVDRKLTAEPNYANMLLEEWEGYLVAIIDNKAYLADSRAMYQNLNHPEYEWFYWEFDKKITSVKVEKRVLYLGTENGIYTLTDNDADIPCHWTTPKNKFNYPQRTKTTNKRGAVVEAEGDISVSVKTEKSEFEHIGDFNDVTDFFVMRIKRKKFKDLQLQFKSTTRFSLESATLECYVGGYIKR